jgi:AhpD family alkylhydroperoxidase
MARRSEEEAVEARIDYRKYAGEPLKALLEIEKYLNSCGLDHKLLHLLKMRASQINGCAYCIDMHSKDARALGESELRLYELDAWRETPFYTERERAALAWAEAITEVAEGHVPDEVFEETKKQFSDKEIVDLTLAAAMINLWNRVAIATRAVPGRYKAAVAQA